MVTHVVIVVAAVSLYNYIKQEALTGCLFEKCSREKMIVIDSDNEDKDYETLARFMTSHLGSEMDSF